MCGVVPKKSIYTPSSTGSMREWDCYHDFSSINCVVFVVGFVCCCCLTPRDLVGPCASVYWCMPNRNQCNIRRGGASLKQLMILWTGLSLFSFRLEFINHFLITPKWLCLDCCMLSIQNKGISSSRYNWACTFVYQIFCCFMSCLDVKAATQIGAFVWT